MYSKVTLLKVPEGALKEKLQKGKKNQGFKCHYYKPIYWIEIASIIKE